jgi:type IV pilus assembly protein PilV
MNSANKEVLTSRSRGESGFSLVEMMVAFLILSIGLLGLAMLQAKSLRLNTDAYMRSQATLIAHELMENMRANPTGNYAYAGPGKPTGGCGSCNAVQQARYDDLVRWYDALNAQLPAGVAARIERPGSNYEIYVSWKERDTTVTQNWVVSL